MISQCPAGVKHRVCPQEPLNEYACCSEKQNATGGPVTMMNQRLTTSKGDNLIERTNSEPTVGIPGISIDIILQRIEAVYLISHILCHFFRVAPNLPAHFTYARRRTQSGQSHRYNILQRIEAVYLISHISCHFFRVAP